MYRNKKYARNQIQFAFGLNEFPFPNDKDHPTKKALTYMKVKKVLTIIHYNKNT